MWQDVAKNSIILLLVFILREIEGTTEFSFFWASTYPIIGYENVIFIDHQMLVQ